MASPPLESLVGEVTPPPPAIIKPPERLSVSGDARANWKMFKQQFTDWLEAVGMQKQTDARKVALMLTVAGPEALEAYNNMLFKEPGDEDKLARVLYLMDVHFSTRNKNEALERFSFRSRLQQPGETFDSFLRDVRLKAQRCHYGALGHSVLRDQIVCGVQDAALRERLLRAPGLTLEGAVKICRAAEMTATSPAASLSDAAAAAACVAPPPGKHRRQSNDLKGCRACGNPWHVKPARCPAYGARCSRCKKKNHFTEFCRSSKIKIMTKRGTGGSHTLTDGTENCVNTVEDTDGGDTFTVGAETGAETCKREPEPEEHVDVKEDEMDTGAALAAAH